MKKIQKATKVRRKKKHTQTQLVVHKCTLIYSTLISLRDPWLLSAAASPAPHFQGPVLGRATQPDTGK